MPNYITLVSLVTTLPHRNLTRISRGASPPLPFFLFLSLFSQSPVESAQFKTINHEQDKQREKNPELDRKSHAT